MIKSIFIYTFSIILLFFLSYRLGTWVFRYKNPVYTTVIKKEIIPIDSMVAAGLIPDPNIRYERVTTLDVLKTTNGFLMFKDSVVNSSVKTVKVADK